MQWIGIALLAGLAIWIYRERARRSRRMAHLARHGKAAEGVVTRRIRRRLPKGGARRFLAYRFTADGGEQRGIAAATAQEYLEHPPGRPIAVIHDPDEPAHNTTRALLVRRGYLATE